MKEETRNRILAIAEKLRYVPNINARNLVLNKSFTIGLFFSTIRSGTTPYFFLDAVSGAGEVVKRDYNLVVHGIDEYDDFLAVNRKRFDGILLISQSRNDDPFIENVFSKQIPLVVLNREIEARNVTNIVPNEKEGICQAVRFLIGKGHRRVAIIEGRNEFQSSVFRRDIFLKALEESRVPVPAEYRVPGGYTMEGGYAAMNRLLALGERPTAVFCLNDVMAVGAIKAISNARLRVPDDISIVGFDDSVVCRYTIPALTSITKPIHEISRMGAEKLLERIQSPDMPGEKLYVNTRLVVRDSIGWPHNKVIGYKRTGGIQHEKI